MLCEHALRIKSRDAGVSELPNKRSASTIIVVDDDASIRRALATQLRVLGFNVTVFPSGEAMLASDFPTTDTCLLLDVYMPAGISGLELCRSLTAAGRQLPTILMSGSNDEPTKRIMRQIEGIAYLFKPFDETTLVRALAKAFRKRSRPKS